MNFGDMYTEYRRVTDGVEYIKEEYGFMSYQVIEDRIYLLEWFLLPEYRKTPINEDSPTVKLVRSVENIGRERGCKYVMSNVEHSNPAKNSVMKHLFQLGFKLSHNVGENLIVMYKEL